MAMLNDLLQSPETLALAAGLLSASGPSPYPTSFGQALGGSMKQMQAAKNQDIMNKLAQAHLGMYQQEANQKKAALDAQNQLLQLFGTPGVKLTGPVSPGLLDNIGGTGYIGNKIEKNDMMQQAAPLLFAMGQPAAGLGLLMGGENDYGTPQSVLDAKGNPKLIQTDKYGHVREVPGYLPQPKNAMTIYDPVTGAPLFTQGGTPTAGQTTADGFIKNQMMGPSRGGQGGTYVDPNTGKIISTNTNKQTSQDQATVGAIQRLEPMMDSVIKNLPQFQLATTKAKSYAQGLQNKYLGANFELPSQQAEGQSSLNAIPDPLLKVLGLPSTDEGLKTIRAIVEPHDGESPQHYKERAIRQLITFRNDYGSQAKNRLAHGITVQEPNQNQMQQPGNPSPITSAPTNSQTIRRYNPATGRIE